MKTLILIDNDYPYKSGGGFIDNEILYLGEVFDQIVVFTIGAKEGDSVLFTPPEKILCYPLNCYSGRGKELYYLIKGMFCNRRFSVPIERKGIKKVLSSIYIRGRASEISSKICKVIHDKEIAIEKATVYSFWFTYQAVSALIVSNNLRREGIPTKTVSRAHGYDLYSERSRSGYLPYQDMLLHSLDMVYPCSNYGRYYLMKRYPWASGKMQVSKLGSRDYGLGKYDGGNVFVTCSNLQGLKRVSLFAKAFSLLSKRVKDVYWICIGDGEEFMEVKAIVDSTGVEDNVKMMGKIDNREVIELYKRISIKFFCNVSTTEGIPVSIMEAMSFGIPIIATDVGGNSELVDSSNGRLIPSDLNEESLSMYLNEMLSINTNDYLILRKNSRQKWEDCYSANNNYKSFCKQLADLC